MERLNNNFMICVFSTLIILVLLKQELLAQNIDIDSERIKIKVEYIAVIDGESTTATLHHLSNDFSVFEWFKSEADSMQEYFDMENINFNINIYNEEGLFVCKDFSDHKMFSREVSIINHYYVTDIIPTVDWVIYPEEKIIGGYKSKKAEGFFRGRNYTVWFTPEIPISNGPWKLGGLPGLILEVTDEEGRVQFNFHDIYIDTRDQNISDNFCDGDDIGMITWKEYVTNVSEDMKQFESILNDRIGAGINIKIGPQFFIEKHAYNNENE